MKAAEDFFLLIVYAHTIAAAETIQNLSGASKVSDVARAIVSNYVLFPMFSFL